MSIRQGMLALLAEQPMHVYQLRQQFEQRTGGTWPLNIGQAYTTVQRLVRDGLAEPLIDETDADVERFRLTEAGLAEITAWWASPVERGAPARDELVIKLALAVTAPGVDVRDVIQRQRRESMRALHDYTRLKATPAEQADELAWSLVLDHLIFAAEAEVRWLDHVEARASRAATERRSPARPAEGSESPRAARSDAESAR
ncbi:MAG: PadR family transcriptional regulator [Cellulomonadaceae bacterium]|nr:PadR family transcriptional regulator [Cellulomonadaceae bacterium]